MRRTFHLLLAVGLCATACDLNLGGCLLGPCGSQYQGPSYPTFRFLVEPSDAAVGAVITPAVQVAREDTNGQLSRTFSGLVTLQIEDNSAGGEIVGSPSTTAKDGIAVFDSLVIDHPGTGFTLRVDAPGCWTSYSQPFSIVPAGAVLDQRQAMTDSTMAALDVGGSSNQALAQVVTVGVSGELVAIRLPVACDSGGMIVEVHEVVNDLPGPTVLATETIALKSLPWASGPGLLRTLVMRAPASFSAGDRFAVVLTSPGGCSVVQGPEGDSYPGGDAFFAKWTEPGAVWLPLTTHADLPFETLVR